MYLELTPEQKYTVTAHTLLEEADANANSDQPDQDFVSALIWSAAQFLDETDIEHFLDVNPRVRQVMNGTI